VPTSLVGWWLSAPCEKSGVPCFVVPCRHSERPFRTAKRLLPLLKRYRRRQEPSVRLEGVAFGTLNHSYPMTQEREPIGSRVRRLRTERGIAQDRLAISAHVDQSGLSKFERNNRGMGEIPLRRIAKALGLAYEDLIAGSDFPSSGQGADGWST
jgi:hypothetical protein